jgi:hypothetical protein
MIKSESVERALHRWGPWVKAGEVREDIDPEAAAMVLFGIIQGLVNIWALGNYSFDPQEKYVPLWHIFCEAVVKR